jgi:hypothetical protein
LVPIPGAKQTYVKFRHVRCGINNDYASYTFGTDCLVILRISSAEESLPNGIGELADVRGRNRRLL